MKVPEGYNIDGVIPQKVCVYYLQLIHPLVKGRIFKVKFVRIANKTQITLVEEEDSIPNKRNSSITQGEANRGKYFSTMVLLWKEGQSKDSVNPQSKFDSR